MGFIKVLLVLVEILTAFLLIGVVLLQRSKSQGMGGLAFGAAMGESLFGARAGNVLTRATVILGIIFLFNTTLLAMMGGRQVVSSLTDDMPVTVPVAATPAAAPAPAPMSAPDLTPMPVPVAQPPVAAPAVDAAAPVAVEASAPAAAPTAP